MKNVVILIALILLVSGYTHYADDSSTPPNGKTEESRDPRSVGIPAPDFAFQDIHGRKHALADYKGRVVLLNFWASWCAPCGVEFPQMLDLAASMPDQLTIIFLSQDENDKDIQNFLKKHGRKLPLKNVLIARDENQDVAQNLYQTFRLPETYVVSPDLLIADKIIGADVEWNGHDMRGKIEKIYKGD